MACRLPGAVAAAASLAGALSLGPFAAAAQPFTRAASSGLEKPAVATAAEDDPGALLDNPGGLAFFRGFGLEYLRQQAYALRGTSADGLVAATSLGPLVLGGSVEWLSPADCTASCNGRVRRTSWGGALRAGMVGLGVVRHGFSAADNYAFDGLASWDVGLMVRPARALSLSLAVLDADEPRFAGGDLKRRWVVGAALRPMGERLTLAADAAFATCGDGSGSAAQGIPSVGIPVPAACGTSHPGLRFMADLAVGRGVHVVGSASRNAQLDTWSGQLGLAVDFSNFGVRYAQTLRNEAGPQGNLRVRISSESFPSAARGTHAASIKLDEALEDKGPGIAGALLGRLRRDPHADLLGALHRLAADPSVGAVVLRSSGLPGSLAKADELRRSLGNLRAAGKKVVFLLESGGDLEYYVASAADRILAAPQAVLTINGFSATALFAAAGLQKLGVKAEFVRVGAYKNAPDIFTRESMSAEQREVENALLDDVYGRFVHEVAVRRSLPEEKVKALLDRGLLRPKEAVEAGLFDGLAYPDGLEKEVEKAFGQKLPLRDLAVPAGPEREERWGPKPRIALIRVEGDIASGETRGDPFGAVRMVGSSTVVRQIRKAADDPGVKAIVVRIDSPGGDGNASDLIWRELVRARKEKKKPVVASMGDVAASGGYYVAAAADEIFAGPSTITGSIGVFVPKFSAQELYGKLGLHFETNKRGKSADLFSTTRPLDEEEKTNLQGWIDEFYGNFLDRVAERGKLTRAQVDEVARGRVWTGRQAHEKKLVDTLGGLEEALAAAKVRAGLARDADVSIEDAGRAASSALSELAGAPGASTMDAALMLLGLPKREALQTLRALQIAGEPGTLRAILPFSLEVH